MPELKKNPILVHTIFGLFSAKLRKGKHELGKGEEEQKDRDPRELDELNSYMFYEPKQTIKYINEGICSSSVPGLLL